MSFPNDLRDLNLPKDMTDFTWTPMKADKTLNMMTAPVMYAWANWAAAWTAWGDMTAKTFGMPTPSSVFFPGGNANENAPAAPAKAEVKAETAVKATEKSAPKSEAKAEAVAAPMVADAVLPASESEVVHVASAAPGEGVRPKGLGFPRNGKPDDLKMISGVGPKIEKTLHGLGIFHFDQVASWHADELKWVDGYLNFKGRAIREDWVAQADALAVGGRDEYVRRFGKEPR